MKKHIAILGTQFGDEGKGKITDYLAKDYKVIVRCQGGDNAGHTVYVKDKKYVFHLLPSAVLHNNKIFILGNGMVINPKALQNEVNQLKQIYYDIGETPPEILVSARAHVITKDHILEDKKKNK